MFSNPAEFRKKTTSDMFVNFEMHQGVVVTMSRKHGLKSHRARQKSYKNTSMHRGNFRNSLSQLFRYSIGS